MWIGYTNVLIADFNCTSTPGGHKVPNFRWDRIWKIWNQNETWGKWEAFNQWDVCFIGLLSLLIAHDFMNGQDQITSID